jgi:hypothetical protein
LLGVVAVLETHDEVVSVSHDDNFAPGMPPAPLIYPKIEDVMEEDVRKER